MSKKIIAVLCAAILTVSLSVTVFAANARVGNGASDRVAAVSENAEAKQQINDLRTEIRQNRLQINGLSVQNNKLRASCRSMISDIKESGTALSDETLSELTALNEEIRTTYSLLAETKGDVRAASLEFRLGNSKEDYDAAIAALNSIIDTQAGRIANMQQANTQLQALSDLLSSATGG